jgi:pyocin large subunit-like protein
MLTAWLRRFIVCCILAPVGSMACRDAGSARLESAPAATAPAPTAAAVPNAPASPIRAEIGFRTAQRLAQHWEKHRAEFEGLDRAGYLRAAQELRDAPADADILELRRSDGVLTRFDRRSGAFIAFEPDGVIRTFFKPTDGEAYFRRQARRR